MGKAIGFNHEQRQESFLTSLVEFSREHRAAHWAGTFADFLKTIVPNDPMGIARNSHEYMWDMIRWQGCSNEQGQFRCKLFDDELFGVDDSLERLVDYFKAASAGSEVGRRLLLLLGPPSGGKSTLVILLKRGLEEYSRTESGAIYGIQGCPVHESPLHLIPHTLRPAFRETYGVEVSGELCPYCVSRLTGQFGGDFMQMPVQRIFVSEAGRIGVGTYTLSYVDEARIYRKLTSNTPVSACGRQTPIWAPARGRGKPAIRCGKRSGRRRTRARVEGAGAENTSSCSN